MKTSNVFFETMYQMYVNHPFISGMIVSAILIALVYLLICALFLFRAKRLRELSYNTPRGQVVVRSTAIAAFVRSLEKKFPELKTEYIQLLQKNGQIVISMTAVFTHGYRTMPEAGAAWEECVLDEIKNTFGISSIKKVEVRMVDAVPKKEE